jgi:hypothetical protein
MDWSKGCDSINIPLKSGNKSHKISLFYFKFKKVPNFAPKKSLVLRVLILYCCLGLFLRWDYGWWSASLAFIGSWVLRRVLWGINGANISYSMKHAKYTIISPYTLQLLYSWYHWKALDEYPLKNAWPIFWAKFPHLVTKKTRGLPLLQRILL